MMITTISFEELHDSEINEQYLFRFLSLKVSNTYNVEFRKTGYITLDTITTNVISLNVYIDDIKICNFMIYKNDNFNMIIGY